MIEWEDDDLSRSSSSGAGSWHVSWEGKRAVLPAHEQTSESTRRVYFLLPPNVAIPPVVTLTYEPVDNEESTTRGVNTRGAKGTKDSLQLNPLPAIFPPELGATGRSAGKKGVLHTIWAKKRLQSLEKEIHAESLNNVEGIALHMALQEKEWIENNFGIGGRADSDLGDSSTAEDTASSPTHYYPMGPTTPVSPSTAGKLTDKLKGLKLRTSQRDLSAPNTATNHLLSPQSPDVAVSYYTSFPGKQSDKQPTPSNSEPAKTVVPQYPPESISQQNANMTGFATMSSLARTSSADSGEELFAKALSPRSPDLPRSPFSFATEKF
ncbi:hypothetical protein PHISCL_10251, partial [Aspergillus sclerotialis]